MRAPDGILDTQLLPPPRAGRSPRFGLLEVYAVLAVGSFFVARFVPVLELFHVPCPFLALTDHPCATCGMTHAFVLLAHGDVLAALRWSPAGAALAAIAWTFGIADLVRVAIGRPLPAVPARTLRRAAIAGTAALAINWAWLIHRGYGA
ncbi:MAG TPA: DUF2752 domain-containing protein [Anaeromyxobacter sp.]|nr:DUF2752 domain-containing protein [Anaeromyxobacter sp.]